MTCYKIMAASRKINLTEGVFFSKYLANIYFVVYFLSKCTAGVQTTSYKFFG